MTADTVFSVANTTALVTWVVLVLFQRRRWATDVLVPVVVSVFAATYVVIIASTWLHSSGGFSSLPAVSALFSNPWVLLAGWLHYLAFDLLVGRWEVRDGAARGIQPWLIAPLMALTFMFGPAGWLSYGVLRQVVGRAGGSGYSAQA